MSNVITTDIHNLQIYIEKGGTKKKYKKTNQPTNKQTQQTVLNHNIVTPPMELTAGLCTEQPAINNGRS